MNPGEVVITGEMDGKLIWRRRTTEEVLLNELYKMEKEKVCKLCDGEGKIKVGEDDNIKEVVCPDCTCKACMKNPCSCDSDYENSKN